MSAETDNETESGGQDFTSATPQYDTLSWQGHELLQCKLCPFDTLDGQVAMMAHHARVHRPPPPVPNRPIIPIYDKWGNRVSMPEEGEYEVYVDGSNLDA